MGNPQETGLEACMTQGTQRASTIHQQQVTCAPPAPLSLGASLHDFQETVPRSSQLCTPAEEDCADSLSCSQWGGEE